MQTRALSEVMESIQPKRDGPSTQVLSTTEVLSLFGLKNFLHS